MKGGNVPCSGGGGIGICSGGGDGNSRTATCSGAAFHVRRLLCAVTAQSIAQIYSLIDSAKHAESYVCWTMLCASNSYILVLGIIRLKQTQKLRAMPFCPLQAGGGGSGDHELSHLGASGRGVGVKRDQTQN